MAKDEPDDGERAMEQADEANREGRPDGKTGEGANDTEERYGEDESPA